MLELNGSMFIAQYTQIRQWMETIRTNIETMKGYIREMSQQTFIATKQAGKTSFVLTSYQYG